MHDLNVLLAIVVRLPKGRSVKRGIDQFAKVPGVRSVEEYQVATLQ